MGYKGIRRSTFIKGGIKNESKSLL